MDAVGRRGLNYRMEGGIKLGLKNRKASTAGTSWFVLHNFWRSIKTMAYFYQEMDCPQEIGSNVSLRSWGSSGEIWEERLYLEAPQYEGEFVLMPPHDFSV